MGKLKNEMIAAEEQFWNEASPDLSMDDLIREDILFRYGVYLDVARSMQNLMSLSPPPEALYVHNQEIYDLWWSVFTTNEDGQHSAQLELWEGQHYG
jgi:hypothetical protein